MLAIKILISFQNSYSVIPKKLSYTKAIFEIKFPKCDHIQKLFPKLNLVTNTSDIINLLPYYNVPIKLK